MKMIRGTRIGDAQLTSSTIPETAPAAYAAGTTYALGARASVATTGNALDVYESLQAANVGHAPASSPDWWRKVATTYGLYSTTQTFAKGDRIINPTTHRTLESVQAANTNKPLTDVAWWIDIGPTNRWAMFDDAVGTLAGETGEITVVLAPGSVDGLAIIDTTAETVRVVVTNGLATVYDVTKSTNVGGSSINSWFKWFFEPIGKKTVLTFLDLPSYPNCVVTVTITGANPAGEIKVGSLIVGRQFDLGSTEVGGNVGITDFSRKVTDDFGVTTVVERAWSKRMTLRAMVATEDVDGIVRELAKVRAKPTLFIGEEGFDSLSILGFYKDFDVDLALANISYVSLTVEGLTQG
jgi:hypothetical protein